MNLKNINIKSSGQPAVVYQEPVQVHRPWEQQRQAQRQDQIPMPSNLQGYAGQTVGQCQLVRAECMRQRSQHSGHY
jgi:hypothetical protein